jgi:hypothetical protein
MNKDGTWHGKEASKKQATNKGSIGLPVQDWKGIGLKSKDLVMVPFRVALAAQADGWYVRSDIIWSKVNSLPESVTDRPTKSHEYIFLFTKSPHYYWDQEAVREPSSHPELVVKKQQVGYGDKAATFRQDIGHVATRTASRNIRSVWETTTRPCREALAEGHHFAVFPESIPRICILAGTSEKGRCPTCGTPWVRIMERGVGWRPNCKCYGTRPWPELPDTEKFDEESTFDMERMDWVVKAATCSHDDPSVLESIERERSELLETYKTLKVLPCVVLDPFCGSGTTLKVARGLGRWAIGIDISETYKKIGAKRADLDVPDILSFGDD